MAGEIDINSLPELSAEQAAQIEGSSWLDSIPEMTRSVPEKVLGTGLNVLDTALLGAGDEVVSGLQAPIRAYSEGIPLGEAYDQNLGITRQTMAKFREDNPKTAIGLNLVGGVISPASKIFGAGSGVYNGARAGAMQGAAYGFNSGEGDISDRVETGAEGIVTGGVLGGALGAVGSGLKAMAKKAPEARLSRVAQALGITKTDWKRAADKGRGISYGEDDEALTILDRAVRYVDDNFDVGRMDKDALQKALADARTAEGSKIGSIIKEVDATLTKRGAKVFPDLADVKATLESPKTGNALTQNEMLGKLKSAVETYKEKLSGSLADIESQKRVLQEDIYGKKLLGGIDTSLDSQIATSLKKASEAIISAEKGADKAKAFEAAKKAYANLQIVEQLAGFANYTSKKGAADEELFKMFNTTRGKLTSPAATGGNVGESIGTMIGQPQMGRAAGVLAGLGLGAASYGANTNAGRRGMIRMLEGLPGAVSTGGQLMPSASTLGIAGGGALGMLPHQQENAAAYEYPFPTTSQYDELIARLTGR